MKTSIQLAASAVALAGLLFGVAAQATNLAELPLKASVLAKPNVIFGVDNSTSMDSEVMLDTSDGAFWWDYTAAAGFDGSGKPLYNPPGGATAQWRKFVYLFPNSTATGARTEPDEGNAHFAIPPTPQFASLRSSSYNPIYYNPAVTYAPWSPYYSSAGAVVSFANATTTAAKSHPIIGTTVLNLSANVALSTATNTSFMVFPGMIIPAGSQTCVASVVSTSWGTCVGGWTTETVQRTVPAATMLRLAMAYYPATYYMKEPCTLSPAVCVAAPDGSTLKRYEIKATTTSYPGPNRTYANELQNFANWWQFYRKRKLMLSAAMGKVLEPLTGLRLGYTKFNGPVVPTMYDTDAVSNAVNGMKVTGLIYELTNSNGSTPTREMLQYIGQYYVNTPGVIQYACQRNNAFIVTDGFATVTTVTPPPYNPATWGTGAPYQTIYPNTLADIALSYYTNNLVTPTAAMPAGKVPITSVDTNRDLHMNTYAMTLGAKGTIFVNDTTPVPTLESAWPNPNQNRNPTSVDDLWHATINGRGKMYLAISPEETALRVREGLDDILDQTAAQGAVSVSSVNLDRGDGRAYRGQYNPRGWSGDLTANPIDVTTAAVSSTPNWSAAAVLAARNWTTRVIFSASGASGIDFSAANVGAAVNPDAVAYTNQQVVEYLRGNRTGEGSLFRQRSSLLGAVVNAEPVLARDESMVYLASGDGMLHGFDTATGVEQWAFAPPDSFAALGRSVQRGWVYQTLLDAAPTYAKLSNGSKLLVGGMGAAGRSYYALDVSAPRGLNSAQAAAQFRWVFPGTADAANRAKVGYTVGRPVIGRTAADGDVVLVTSGYDNGVAVSDRGRLWVLNATTGAVIRSFRTAAGAVAPGQEAGLAHVSAFKESDGTMRYAYGGDLLGNVWKFDLTRAGTELDAELLATLQDPSGNAQPVTSAPELVPLLGRRVVLVGTGQLLDIGDFGSSRVQSFYAIADGATLTNARTGLVRQTYTRATDTMSANTVNWATDRGWYFDIAAGEQVNTDPVVIYGAVTFVSNVNGGANCSQSSYMYLVDIGTGTKVATSAYVSRTISTDATSSGVITLRTGPTCTAAAGPGCTNPTGPPRIIGTTHRSDNTIYQDEIPVGQTILPAKNAWREVRR